MQHMVRHLVCLATVAGAAFGAFAETYRVTPDATAGTGDGLSWGNPLTLAEAIAKTDAEVILCQYGLYGVGSTLTVSKPVAIMGGYAGTDDTTLDSKGSNSVFKVTTSSISVFNVSTDTSVADTNRFERCTFTGVSQGVNQAQAAVVKTGKANVVFAHCQFRDNSAKFWTDSYNAGTGVGAKLSGSADTVAVFSDCVFRNNVNADGGGRGQGFYAATFKEIVLENCLFSRNGVSWSTAMNWNFNVDQNGKGTRGTAFYVTGAKVTARGCRFIGNRAVWGNDGRGGTVSLNGDCDGSSFENCLFLGNMESFGSTLNANWMPAPNMKSESTGILTVNLSESAGSVAVRRSTFAYNLANGTASGTAVTVRKGTLAMSDSILYGNEKASWGTAGADLALMRDGFASVTNTFFTEDSAGSVSTVVGTNLSLDTSVQYGDPRFVTPRSSFAGKISSWTGYTLNYPYFTDIATVENFDVHTTSPAGYYTRETYDAKPVLVVDRAAPMSPAASLGNYVGTAEATVLPSGQPAIDALDVEFPGGVTRPRISVRLGAEDDDALYLASVAVTLRTNGVVAASGTGLSLTNGATAVVSPVVYFRPGTLFEVEVRVSANEAEDVVRTIDATAVGQMPIWYGHGGGANVIHVRAGADGKQDGTSWENAFSRVDLAIASLTAERNEVWLSGEFGLSGVVTVTPTSALAIRGGFDGHEDAANERTNDTLVATLDAGHASKCLNLVNGAAAPVTIERVAFLRGKDGCLQKTGAGNLDLLCCRIANGQFLEAGAGSGGMGAALTGTAEAELVVSNCVIESNYSRQVKAGSGIGLNVLTFKSVRLDDSIFRDNGLAWGGASLCNTITAYGASALHVGDAPISVRNCRFVANRGVARSGCGSTVKLSGACGGSAFTNCVFAGNMDTYTGINTPNAYGGDGSAVVYVTLSATTDVVTFASCTLAYNYLDSHLGGAITVSKGSARIVNSVVFGNYRWKAGPARALSDLDVRANGSADIAHSLLSADTNTATSVYVANYGSVRYNEGDEADVIFGDPEFVTPAATALGLIKRSDWGSGYEFLAADYDSVSGFDVHLLSARGYRLNDGTLKTYDAVPNSPAIDAGDPDAPYACEPTPNGGRLNLGAYGNTPEASMTQPVVTFTVLEIPDQVILNGVHPEPALVVSNFVTGAILEKGRDYRVEWEGNDRPGTAVAKVFGIGAYDEQAASASFTVGGLYHVTQDAVGGGTGMSWDEAMTLAEALSAAVARDVVLVKAGVYTNKSALTLAKPLTIRGGLKGTDDTTLAEDGAKSVCTVAGTPSISFFNITTDTSVDDENVLENLVFRDNVINWSTGRAIVRKTGKAGIRILNCEFLANSTSRSDDTRYESATGVGLHMVGSAQTTAVISNCVFAGNVSQGTVCWAATAYMRTFKSVTIDDTLFVTNGVSWESDFNGSITTFRAAALYANAAPVLAHRTRFVGNLSAWRAGDNGSIVLLEGACGGSEFVNCLWKANDSMYGFIRKASYAVNDGPCTASGALVVNLASATDTVRMERCTVAMNHSGTRGSGPGVLVKKGTLTVSESILANNVRDATSTVGADLALQADGYADVRDSMFSSATQASVSSDDPTHLTIDGDTMLYGDPLFVTDRETVLADVVSYEGSYMTYTRFSPSKLSTAMSFDAHVQSPSGHYLDDGTFVKAKDSLLSPAAALGCYVGTPEATVLSDGKPEILSVDVGWKGGYSRPEVLIALGGEEDAVYLANVTVVISTNGVEAIRAKSLSATNGQTVAVSPCVYFPRGTALSVYVEAESRSWTSSQQGEAVVDADYPPWYGKGGPSNVIHVRKGADGAGTGLNWMDAFAEIGPALSSLGEGKNEIWISGDFVIDGTLVPKPTVSFAVRGGFSGWERSPDERPESGCSLLDAAGVCNVLTLANGAGVTATFDRMAFARGADGMFVKSGGGDLNLLGCRFANGFWKGKATVVHGLGANVSGGGVAQVVVSNCVFEGNVTTQNQGPRGIGLSVADVASLKLQDTLFVTNGVRWAANVVNSFGNGFLGSALYIGNCATGTVRGCRFLGNRAATGSSSAGSTVVLTGTSRVDFQNDLWSANMEGWGWANHSGSSTAAGALRIHLASSAYTSRVENCTFAYGYAHNDSGSASGLTVKSGVARVRSSIFYGNRNNGSRGADLTVCDSGIADVDYSLCSAFTNVNTSIVATTPGNLLLGEGMLYGDPLFETVKSVADGYLKKNSGQQCYAYDWNERERVLSFNLHLRSPFGYLDEFTRQVVRAPRAVRSPAVDAGDPAASYRTEAKPSGYRVNMGFYGNTPWATRSKHGGALIVK